MRALRLPSSMLAGPTQPMSDVRPVHRGGVDDVARGLVEDGHVAPGVGEVFGVEGHEEAEGQSSSEPKAVKKAVMTLVGTPSATPTW